MTDEFIEEISVNLTQAGYITEIDPGMPGVQGLLYAHSAAPFRLGFAKVEDHFLFLDWDNALFGRQDFLISAYDKFSKFVNQKFKVPHSLRIRIPNLVVIAVSQSEFPEETIHHARTTYLNPWFGGEIGQILLVDRAKKEIIYHKIPPGRQTGAFPLSHSLSVLLDVFNKSFKSIHGIVKSSI